MVWPDGLTGQRSGVAVRLLALEPAPPRVQMEKRGIGQKRDGPK